jgi:excisionase family DNA binding protein
MTLVDETADGSSTAARAAIPAAQERPGGLLTPGEVAALFRVDPKTVTRWALAGRIGSIRTPGGHRRFHEAEVRALLAQSGQAPVDVPAPRSDQS